MNQSHSGQSSAPPAEGWTRRGRSRLVHAIRHLAPHLLIVIAATLAAGATFTVLAEDVAENEFANLDAIGGRWATAHRSVTADVLFSGITWGGTAFILLPLCLIATWYLWERRGRRVVAPVALAPVFAPTLTGLIKLLFGRARPTNAMVHAMGSSFPSGHTTAATAVALSLTYVLIREQLAPRTLIAVAIAYALLVGASRVYLGAHWSSDVLGGWAIGATIAAGCAALYERARELEHEPV
jgi:membrane-associated phospholipid phosphatase